MMRLQTPLARLLFSFLRFYVSGDSAVWDVEKQRLVFYLRGFRGAYFSDDGTFYADFPEYQGTERNIARLNVFTKQTDLGPKVESYNSKQYGPVIVTLKHQKESGSKNSAAPIFLPGGDLILDVRDTRTALSLWSTTFPSPSTFNQEPSYSVASREGVMVLWWPITAKPAMAEIKSNPALNQQFSGMKDRETNYYVKVLDLRTGKPLGQLLVETGKGSFRIKDAYAANDWLMISDSENRTLVYSLATGQQKGKVFGRRVAVSASSNLLCVQNESGLLSLYDLLSFEKREQFRFSSPVSVTSFSSDGKRLLVVTADQNLYTLDMTPFVARKEQ